VVKQGAVIIGLPPRNANYYERLGVGLREEDLITDDYNMVVKVKNAPIGGTVAQEVDVPLLGSPEMDRAEFPGTSASL